MAQADSTTNTYKYDDAVTVADKTLEEAEIIPQQIFYSREDIKATFDRIIEGYHDTDEDPNFYWQKAAGEPMLLFGSKDGHKLSIIATVGVPEEFNGVGCFTVDWPDKHPHQHNATLLNFFMHFHHVSNLVVLLHRGRRGHEYVGSLYFRGAHHLALCALAEDRFDTIH